MFLQTLVVALISFVSFGISAGNKWGRGFNDDIEWHGFEEGLEVAKEQKKPILLLIHKSWCGACKALKPQFASSKQIEELSKNFVMINCEDDEEPTGDQFTPDGGYIPRIFFMDSDGNVQKKLYNEKGNRKYKYFYSSADQVVASMKKAFSTEKKTEL